MGFVLASINNLNFTQIRIKKINFFGMYSKNVYYCQKKGRIENVGILSIL